MLKRILQLIVVLLIAAQGVMAQTVQIESVTKPPGDIQVPVDMLNFTDVAAITYYINYNSDLMDFNGIDTASSPLVGGWVANADDDDLIVITYTAGTPGVGYDVNGRAFDMLFHYKGGFTGDLTFDVPNCEVAQSNLAPIPNIDYIDGNVAQSSSVGTVSMTDLVDTVGNIVNMPVNMEGAGFTNVGVITLHIAYDPFQLSFNGIAEDALTGVVANANAGTGLLTIEWSSTTPMDFSSLTHLLDIKFVYNGGDADVLFVPGCEIGSDSLNLLATDYTDGIVVAVPGTRTLTIATVEAPNDTVPVMVNVPVVASDFTDDTVGAVTMHINFDNTRLEYAGFTDGTLNGWVLNYNNGAGEIELQWSDGDGSLCEDTIVTLKFNYDTISGNADISFGPGTIVKDKYEATIPVNLINGYVTGTAITYTVSGQLNYNGHTDRPIGTAGSSTTTVYLKNAADSTIAYFGGADADGNFSISGVLPGNYFLDAVTTIPITNSYDATDANVIYYLGNTLVGLEAEAADVTSSDGIDATDANVVYYSYSFGYKLSGWNAPDWLFENTVVNVVSADVSIDFSGICSGDAYGDFIPVP